MSDFDLDLFLKHLPDLPGVYRMIGKNGQVLYVGKAVSLRRRVRSYFNHHQQSPRIQLMVRQIERIEVTATHSESEALILENNLIKSLSPRYNILFRDDKSYPYLKFSAHEFARMSYYRGSLTAPHRYFGPYPDSLAVRQSIDTLQKVFQLRTCRDTVFAHRDRPCLLYQIKRCSAPCTGLITPQEYANTLNDALAFLAGDGPKISENLNQQMHEAAAKLDFETAAQLRDRLQALTTLQSQQFIDSKSRYNKDVDILAAIARHGLICIHLVSIRNGRRVTDDSFFPKTQWQAAEHDDEEIKEHIETFVAMHYLGRMKPEVIICNIELSCALKTTIDADATHKITWVTHCRGERKVWLDMAIQNAIMAINQRQLQSESQIQRRAALAELMQLDDVARLECFDISHTFGEATQASCVVYDDNAMQPSQYRRFNIQTAAAGDDYAAMREALTRRYRAMLEDPENNPRPDVVVIDGGKGQISMALDVWQALGLDIPLVGVAKGPERKAGEEMLILPMLGITQKLPPQHPALHLLQTVRDEAHRFAITGHRQKRAKKRLQSDLDSIEGIGPKRKRALLTRFDGLRGIQAASIQEIAATEGISHALAEKIYHHFHDDIDAM